jgi:hypothetical protein
VRARGEELGDACGVEAVLREADRRPEPRAAGPHHHRVVRVVHHRVGRLESTKRPTTQHNTNEKINRRIPRRATKKLLKKNRRMSAKERRGRNPSEPRRARITARSGGGKGVAGSGRTEAVERSLALERPLETQRRHIARGSQCGGGVWSGGGAGRRGGRKSDTTTEGEGRRLAEVGGKKMYRIRFLYNIVGLYFLFIM